MITVILGLPGAGKSYLAEKVAKELNALYVNSDKIRKEGMVQVDYSEMAKISMYEEMFSSVKDATTKGQHVVLDATFYRKPLRERIMTTAKAANVPIYFIEVIASLKVIQERLKKQRKYSDVDVKLYQQVKEQFEPLEIPHLTLRSDRLSITEMLRQVNEYIKVKANSNEQQPFYAHGKKKDSN